MSTTKTTTSLSQILRNLLIAVAAVILSVGLFWGNTVRYQSVSLESLAVASVSLEEARSNGKPTLMEFYADWCATCQAMAPMMASFEQRYHESINFVLLNVDNPKWLPELAQFRVSGVPHFVFMDATATPIAFAIGDQPESIMERNLTALQSGDLLVELASGPTSSLSASQPLIKDQPQPKSHG